MRIFISAGEASGDAYGAALVQQIKRIVDLPKLSLGDLYNQDLSDEDTLDKAGIEDSLEMVEYIMSLEDEFGLDIPNEELQKIQTIGGWRDFIERKTGIRPILRQSQITFEGVGGKKMRSEQIHLHADSSKWGAISITQGIRVGFGILPKYFKVRKILKQGPPGIFIPIDFGFANIPLARHAKKIGWKVLYFIPPGSWRRTRQGKDLPIITDQISTPFQWSAEILTKMGANAHWFGHPIKQLIDQSLPTRETSGGRAGWRASTDSLEKETVAILPGSRTHELEMTIPLIAGAVTGVTGKWNGRNLAELTEEELRSPKQPLQNQLEFALALSVDADHVKAEWNRLAPGRNDIFTIGDTYGVLKRARAAIICSGTATLEAAMCRCPMVVIYQLSPSMRREAKLLRIKQPKMISLPNIIQDRMIVPELADGHGVYPEQVRAWLDRLLTNEEVRSTQLKELDSLVEALGPSDAITKTAELALSMI